MKRYILNIFLLAGFTVPSFAQSPELNGTLDGIIKEMREAKNGHFILVQAYKDGLLQEGKRYELQYDGSKVSIDGKVLGGQEQRRYSEMYREFLGSDDAWGSMRGDGLKLAKILDRKSDMWFNEESIRVAQMDADAKLARHNELTELIEAELKKDGFTRTGNYFILYNKSGVFINGQIPLASLYAKYEGLCKEYLGYKPMRDDDEFRYSVTK